MLVEKCNHRIGVLMKVLKTHTWSHCCLYRTFIFNNNETKKLKIKILISKSFCSYFGTLLVSNKCLWAWLCHSMLPEWRKNVFWKKNYFEKKKIKSINIFDTVHIERKIQAKYKDEIVKWNICRKLLQRENQTQ